MNSPKEKANALKDAAAYAVRDWPKNRLRIPPQLGIYMFSDPEGRRMYVRQHSRRWRHPRTPEASCLS